METSKIEEVCERIYNELGAGGVYEYINKLLSIDKKNKFKIAWEECNQCEAETPHYENACLVCGTVHR